MNEMSSSHLPQPPRRQAQSPPLPPSSSSSAADLSRPPPPLPPPAGPVLIRVTHMRPGHTSGHTHATWSGVALMRPSLGLHTCGLAWGCKRPPLTICLSMCTQTGTHSKMYACMYIHTHPHTHACAHTHTHTHTQVQVPACLHPHLAVRRGPCTGHLPSPPPFIHILVHIIVVVVIIITIIMGAVGLGYV